MSDSTRIEDAVENVVSYMGARITERETQTYVQPCMRRLHVRGMEPWNARERASEIADKHGTDVSVHLRDGGDTVVFEFAAGGD